MIMTDKEMKECRELVNFDICDTVGELYKLAMEEQYDIECFSDMFLKSDFCKREFDTLYSCFQTDEDASIYYFLKECKNKLLKNTNDISEDEAYWVGFMYRYLYIYAGISSDKLVDIIPFKSMLSYVNQTILPYEEYSPDELLEIIDKDLDLKQYQSNIEAHKENYEEER